MLKRRLAVVVSTLLATVLGVVAIPSAPVLAGHGSGDPNIRVRLVAFDNAPTLAFSPGGLAVTNVGGRPAAVLISQVGSNVFDVYAGDSCGGPWGLTAQGVGGPVDIYAASPGEANFVQACEPSGTRRAYKGFLRATRDSEGPQRTVNIVNLEEYLKGVVPRESPASWGDLGGGLGTEALKAQAVAARSYAASEERYSYADTCDTTACQVYGGYWDTQLGVREDSRTNQAVAATAGEVRYGSGVQRTEFSSSTGGHTAGGTFPAVVDDGDAISSNPHHRWNVTLPVSQIQSSYPAIGTFTNIEITARNGLGEWGGRVSQVRVSGTSGSVTRTGDEFRREQSLKSDWFTVTSFDASNVNVAGAGYGHGRGMGQWGSLGYAVGASWGYRQILSHFYSNTQPGYLPGGGVIGYWVLDRVGGIFTFGDAAFHGSLPQLRQQGVPIGNAEVIDIEPTPSGNGYWLLDKAGGIFSFGDAQFFGSIPQLRQQGVPIGPADVIDLAVTSSGNGYWLLDSVGGMFAFGDAQFLGSIPQLREQGVSIGRAKVVDMTTTPAGDGYVMIDEVGGAFVFGNGQFYGSLPALRQQGVSIGGANVVGVATLAGGYWMVDRRGGIFAFGSAPFHGSLPGAGVATEAAGIAPTKTGGGYLIVSAENGEVYRFGDAPDFGGIPDTGVRTFGRGIAPRYR